MNGASIHRIKRKRAVRENAAAKKSTSPCQQNPWKILSSNIIYFEQSNSIGLGDVIVSVLDRLCMPCWQCWSICFYPASVDRSCLRNYCSCFCSLFQMWCILFLAIEAVWWFISIALRLKQRKWARFSVHGQPLWKFLAEKRMKIGWFWLYLPKYSIQILDWTVRKSSILEQDEKWIIVIHSYKIFVCNIQQMFIQKLL